MRRVIPHRDPGVADLFATLAHTPTKAPTPRSGGWATHRWRERRTEAQRHVLRALTLAGAAGISTSDLRQECGNSALSRVAELRGYGWCIEDHRHPDRDEAVYTLTRDTIDPSRAARPRRGAWKVYEWADGTIEVVRMGARHGIDTPDVWDEDRDLRDALGGRS